MAGGRPAQFTEGNTVTMKRALIVGTLCLVAAGLATAGQAAGDSGWPQWRGPNRNGIAPSSPKLLDSWPKEGPKLLWPSAPIPSGTDGGCGSVTVAGGRVFVFVHWRFKGPKSLVITTEVLNDLGWMDGVPDDLAKKIEDTRVKGRDLRGEKLDAHAKAFLATLEPATAAKYASFAEQRLRDRTFEWKTLATLAALRDQEFASWDALLKKAGFLIFPGESDKYNAFRDQLLEQGYHYTDTVLCLDAETGKELWRKDFPSVIPTPTMMMYIGASSTPKVWEDKCYATGSAGLYCLSVKDGEVVWQAKTKFSNSSPLVANGIVYCCVPQLTAFDARTGKILWTSDAGLQSPCSSAVLWNTGGKDYIVGGHSARNYCVFCVEAATGEKVWTTKPSSGGYSSPVIAGDMLVMNESGPSIRAYKITQEAATFLWAKDAPDHRGASLLVHDGYVYSTAGRYFSTPLRCFDLWTGEEKWVGIGDHGGNAEGASPILADGKGMAQVKDPDTDPGRGGSWTVMFRARPEKFEELGQFHSDGATCTSPSIVNGRLYLRQQHAVACWDVAEHRPYMDGVRVVRNGLVFDVKQAEGGLAAAGPIEGLAVTDPSGKPQAAKTRVNRDSLVLDTKGLIFPIRVAYQASGNLSAKNGPLAPFEWTSPRLIFERCEGDTLVIRFERFVDPEAWRSEKAYTVAGTKITGVELDRSGETLRLTTDKTWKEGEKVTVKYPALHPGSPSDRTAEYSFIVTQGRPVTEVPLLEFLFGELREKIDHKTTF